jgi:hypothetical protein
LHIRNSDKNLGTVVRQKQEYMEGIYSDHLRTNAYKQLTKEEAEKINEQTHLNINNAMGSGCGAKKAITAYINRSTQKRKRDGELYGLSKLHKDPIVDRPIISGVGSITEGISKIADYYVKKIIPHAPTQPQDYQTLIRESNKIGPLPPNAKLFTADDTSMYTNIQPDVGITSIATWIKAYPKQCCKMYHRSCSSHCSTSL